jgi:membrane peptidoglycan carboxypeptidase
MREHMSGRHWGVPHVSWRKVARVASLAVLASMLGFFLLSAFVYWWYAHDLESPAEATGAGPSVAYDRTGQTQLYQFADPLQGVREPVSLSEISPYLIAATIATEDASFYNNPGVNFRGMARAAAENLLPFSGGFFAGSGGSSITQQLARNVYIDPARRADRTLKRKIKETVIALELKRRYSDDQILEWYLNQIYYGNGAYGVQAASERYFGKPAKDLTLAEAALLAGLPQAPADYSPASPENREAAKTRQLEVLDLMKRNRGGVGGDDAITVEEIEAARSDPLTYVDEQIEIKAPHFVYYVEDQVKKMCAAGLFRPPARVDCESVTAQGGLRITTTLDTGLQAIGEQAVEKRIAETEANTGGHNGSLVAIKPETGEILTYVGSRGFFRDDIQGQVDIASSLQSLGSSMKVFTYLTAFDQGWLPSTSVKDEPLDLGDAQVNNWDLRYQGGMTVRRALAESVNTVAVRTVIEVGIDEMRRTAHRMGITDLQEDTCGPPITLGACEVKLVDMTYAFAGLANNGVMKGRPSSERLPGGYRELDPVSVLSIQDVDGNTLYQFEGPEAREVENPASVYMLTDILSRDAVRWSRLTIDRPAAAKTGTSEDFRDAVVMGYTPDLAVGTWMGNADNAPMAPGTFSSQSVGPLWTRFMEEAHDYLGLPPRDFTVPDSIEKTRCAGKDELIVRNVRPSRPGACHSKPSPSASPSATPESVTPSPSASPGETPAEATDKPTSTPEVTPEATPQATPTPDVTPAPTFTAPPTGPPSTPHINPDRG